MHTTYTEQFKTIDNILDDFTRGIVGDKGDFIEYSCTFAAMLTRHEINPMFIISYMLYKHLFDNVDESEHGQLFRELNEDITVLTKEIMDES